MDYGIMARNAEKQGKWWEAIRLWKCFGGDYGMTQASVCQTIAEAIDKGDEYRALLGDSYQRWESREINNSQLYEVQCEAHKKVYGN